MNGVLEIEMGDELGKIVGIMIHIVAVPRLARTAMTAAVMGDAAIAVRCQKKHLVFEGVGGKRPAVAKNYRLSLPPIL
jgi:hypothetical protein